MPKVICEAEECRKNICRECVADEIELVIDERTGQPICFGEVWVSLEE